MRRAGLILLAVGLAGFLLGSSQRARYESREGAPGAGIVEKHRKLRDAWETARWLFVGTAVIGLVFTALPGKK
ncbi:MAG: hypothetical protein WEB59_11105 [Thermoanaerobaculia bacterium]